ncbi:BMP-binding endothelial regulator protein-like [Saccoglossus kowalevskii]
MLLKSPTISVKEDGYMVKLKFMLSGTEFMLEWTLKKRIFTAKLSGSSYRGKLCGLLGNADGNSLNDFQKPDGIVVHDVVEFGESWKNHDMKCDEDWSV